MVVQLRTNAQATKVAELTGGTRLPGTPKPDRSAVLSQYVDVGVDFESPRTAGESVSVLFDTIGTAPPFGLDPVASQQDP